MWLNAEKVVLLKFTHKDPVKELRICYHRFRRRGENHYDPAANGEEDVYYNLKAEQKQRKDLNLVEEYCLNSLELTMQCKRISLAMNDVPFRAVSQACAALFELGIAERDDVVGAETNLESCIWKALKQSLDSGSRRKYFATQTERFGHTTYASGTTYKIGRAHV